MASMISAITGGVVVDIHKVVLLAVLAAGGVALLYNALSIVNGQSGLAQLAPVAEGRQLAHHPF
jgi:hypothetical protein